MIQSIYKQLKSYEEVGGDMLQRIKDLGVYDVFQPLAEDKKYQGETFNKVLWWILDCYSNESDKVIAGADWKKTKESIAKEYGVPKSVPTLEDEAVSATAWNYIRHQEDADWEHYCMLKEQYIIMREGALGIIKRERKDKRLAVDAEELHEEEVDVIVIVYDYKEMFENGLRADNLRERIATYEKKIKTSGQTSDQAAKEIQEKQSRSKGVTLEAGSYAE